MSALDELLHALQVVEDHLDQARGQIARGRRSLAETRAALAQLDPEHPETVVPPGLSRADDQIERTAALLDHVTDALSRFSARL